MKHTDAEMAEKLKQISGLDDWLADKAYDSPINNALTPNPESFDNGVRVAFLYLRHMIQQD